MTQSGFCDMILERIFGMVFMAYSSNITKEEQKRLALEKIEKSFTKINSDVFSIFDKDTLPVFLAFMAKFHYFDIYNLILIFKQRPTATFIAAFNTWERISINHWHDPSRRVFPQKPKSIGILAPYILKKKISDAMNLRSASVGARIVSYFDYHVVYVFDKAETNGIPAPVIEWDLSKNKKDAEAAFQALKAVAPFSIVFSADENFKGNYVFEDNTQNPGSTATLVLNAKYRFDHYTLCNFIIRSFVLRSLENIENKYSADDSEKLVECVSFVIASYFGLSTNEYTFFFARMWATNSQNMLEILNTVRQLAHMLIENIESEMIEYKSQFGDDVDIYTQEDDVIEFENLSLFDF